MVKKRKKKRIQHEQLKTTDRDLKKKKLRRLFSLAAHREPCPLVRHVWDAEGSSFVAVGRLLRVGVVQNDSLEASVDMREGQTQLHYLLMGVCDGKQDASSLGGRTHLKGTERMGTSETLNDIYVLHTLRF